MAKLVLALLLGVSMMSADSTGAQESLRWANWGEIIGIGAFIFCVGLIVVLVLGFKGKVVIYRNMKDLGLCASLFISPIVLIIAIIIFAAASESGGNRQLGLLSWIILGLIIAIWGAIFLYILFITLKDNRFNPISFIFVVPIKICLGFLWLVFFLQSKTRGKGGSAFAQNQDKARMMREYSTMRKFVYGLMRDKPDEVDDK